MSIKIQQLETSRGSFRVGQAGDPAAPALILSNSLGTVLEMWSPQVADFAAHYRVICYDTRGHGGSPITEGPYDFAGLGNDVLAIMDFLDICNDLIFGFLCVGHSVVLCRT